MNVAVQKFFRGKIQTQPLHLDALLYAFIALYALSLIHPVKELFEIEQDGLKKIETN